MRLPNSTRPSTSKNQHEKTRSPSFVASAASISASTSNDISGVPTQGDDDELTSPSGEQRRRRRRRIAPDGLLFIATFCVLFLHCDGSESPDRDCCEPLYPFYTPDSAPATVATSSRDHKWHKKSGPETTTPVVDIGELGDTSVRA